MKARLRLVIEPPLSLRLRLLSLRRAFRERFSPEFRLPLVVLLPESFRGGCSFGTGTCEPASPNKVAAIIGRNGLLARGNVAAEQIFVAASRRKL